MPFTNLDYCSFMMAGNRSFMTARPAIDTAKSVARPSLLRGQVYCAAKFIAQTLRAMLEGAVSGPNK
jgi:hypothetical protein